MEKPRVVRVKCGRLFTSSGDADPARLRKMFETGIRLLFSGDDPREGKRRLWSPRDRVGIKINAIGGKKLSTRPDIAIPLAEWLAGKDVPIGNFVIWDRTNRELRQAGYRLSTSNGSLKIFGTDAAGAGYGREIVSHRDVGSLYSTIQEDLITASVSLAVLKDHGVAGVTAGMKNYFGAIHNPNKYHDNRCDPFVADVFDAAPIRAKHRLTVLDATTVQYHRGPSFHPQWAERASTFFFGLDPVAVDSAGWRFIEDLRAKKGLPSLTEERREPLYLASAEKIGLGVSDPDRIEIVEEVL
jgi:uncharacterized protein (DUF362 family)